MSESFTSVTKTKLWTPSVVPSTLSGKKCRFQPQRNLKPLTSNPIIFESPVLRLIPPENEPSDSETDILNESFLEENNSDVAEAIQTLEVSTKGVNDSIIANRKKFGSTQKTPLFRKPLKIEPKRSLFGNPSSPKTLTIDNQSYELLERLGYGGSSEVFNALNMGTSQKVAIKMINMSVDEVTAQGFFDEVTILRKLQNSDYVIKMFGCEVIGDKLCVVLEKGEYDFNEIIMNRTFELVVIVSYWVQMLNAVKCIHDQGIIHSDLKPANFLMVRGQLKLIDFGIASNVQSDCTSIIKTNKTGTLNYISPEALVDIGGTTDSPTAKFNISYKSDIWSLGCILYQLIYGVTPFQHIKSKYGKIQTIVDQNHQIQYPAEPKLPRIVMEVLRNCLIFEMRKRPSVTELLNVNYICNH